MLGGTGEEEAELKMLKRISQKVLKYSFLFSTACSERCGFGKVASAASS